MLREALKRQSTALIAPHGVVARIDLGAIANNIGHFLSATDAQIMAVVPADGFGHGAVRVAQTALSAGATALGVATIGEARTLRRHDIMAPILVWHYGPDDDIEHAIAEGIHLSVPSLAHLAAITQAANILPVGPGRRARIASVHLEIDTGAHVGGCDPGEWRILVEAARLAERRGVVHVTGVWSRPLESNCGEAEDAEVQGQMADLADAVAIARSVGLRPATVHLETTDLTLHGPHGGFDLVRIGLGVDGIDTCRSPEDAASALSPAMSVTAPVVDVHRAGTRAEDHSTPCRNSRTPDGESTLAVVPMGYADGVPGNAASCAYVCVGGSPAPIVGRIGMNQMAIDVGQRTVAVGDEVTVLGCGSSGPSALDWSRWCGVAPGQILSGMGNGPRVLRWYWKSQNSTLNVQNFEDVM